MFMCTICNLSALPPPKTRKGKHLVLYSIEIFTLKCSFGVLGKNTYKHVSRNISNYRIRKTVQIL